MECPGKCTKSHFWNLLNSTQIAIAKFFDGEGPDPVTEALQNIPPPRTARQENLQESILHNSRRSQNVPQHDLAPRIVPQPEDQVVRRPPFLLSLLFTPFSLLYKIFSSAFGLFSYLFPFLPRALRPNTITTVRRRSNTNRRALRPRDCAARLKREIEEEYGPNTVPFFEGGYAQALDSAKKDLKFLFVILLSTEHDDTHSFIRDTLLATSVQTYLNNPSNIILWAGDVRDPEAYEASTRLNCTKFPFTAVIAHNPKISSTAMTVIERITGPMDPSTYVAKLTHAMASHEETLSSVRSARQAQNFERSLRQEQDSAYERSLAADRERARLKKEKEAEEARALKALADKEREKELLAANKLSWRRWRASRLSPEPGPHEKDIVRVALKMPEADRITRRFKADDTMEELYAFVDTYGLPEDERAIEAVQPPKAYEHKFQFRLVQTLPRFVFDVEDGGTIGEKVGKGGNLIVEPILDEEEDEEGAVL